MVSVSACYLLPCIVLFAMLWAGVSPVTLPTAQKSNNAAQQDIRLRRAAGNNYQCMYQQ
jgi:hypothetical protein